MKAGRPVVIACQPEEEAMGYLQSHAGNSQCPSIEAAATIQLQSQVVLLATVLSSVPLPLQVHHGAWVTAHS